ncbi:MAG: hypothetical protein ABSG10_01010 [Terracidiphilus sp.]|jgi:hypothetical protein
MVTRRGKEEPGNNGSNKGKIKFRYMDSERVVDFSVENMAGDSVTEGLHSIANALAGRTLPRGGAPNPKRTLEGARAAEVEEETVAPEVEAPEEELEEIADEASGEDGTSTPVRRRPAPRAPKFLSELNLTTAPLQLEDFIAQKHPQSDMDKYAVIAQWFKEYFNTEEVSIDHIFTAYRKLGWQAQLPGPDPSQTLRNLKKKNWFDNGSKRGDFKINWNGSDAVNKMGVVSA